MFRSLRPFLESVFESSYYCRTKGAPVKLGFHHRAGLFTDAGGKGGVGEKANLDRSPWLARWRRRSGFTVSEGILIASGSLRGHDGSTAVCTSFENLDVPASERDGSDTTSGTPVMRGEIRREPRHRHAGVLAPKSLLLRVQSGTDDFQASLRASGAHNGPRT